MEIKITVPSTKEVKIKPKFEVGQTIRVAYNEKTIWITKVMSIEIYGD